MAKPSYAHGACEFSLEWKSMIDVLDECVQKHPHKEAIVFRGINKPRASITYGAFQAATDRFAARLQSVVKLAFGDVVAIWADNSIEYSVTSFGCVKAGCTTARLHNSMRNAETIRHCIRLVEAKCVIVDELGCMADVLDWLVEAGSARTGLQSIIHVHQAGADQKHHDQLVTAGYKIFAMQALIDAAELTPEETQLLRHARAYVQPDSIYTMFMTSGTTGMPKVVPQTHFALYNNFHLMAQRGDPSASPTFFNDRPASHIGGASSFISALAQGGTLVRLRPQDTVAQDNVNFVLSVLAEEKCTVATFFVYLLFDLIRSASELRKYDLSNLKYMVTGGQIITEKQMHAVTSNIGPIANCFGTTETLINILPSIDADSTEVLCNYVGYPLHHMEVSVRDGSGVVVPIGTTGEVWIRGYTVFSGYYKNPEKTKAALTPDGWYKTGDFGIMYENSYIKILGRKVEMIIRASCNYYPLELENFFMMHGAVAACQVIGVPDARLGEELCACLILRNGAGVTEDELRQFCEQSNYRTIDGLSFTPKYFYFCDSFPQALTGKIDRAELRRQAMQRFSLAFN